MIRALFFSLDAVETPVNEIKIDADKIAMGNGKIMFLRGETIVQEMFAPEGVFIEIDADEGVMAAIEDVTSYSVAQIRESYPRAYRAWTTEEERLLLRMHEAGLSPECIAPILERQEGGISSRLHKLGRK